MTKALETHPAWHLLLFGATGAIGQAILTKALNAGWSVTAVTRSSVDKSGSQFVLDYPSVNWRTLAQLSTIEMPSANAVCWAQGANANDSVYTFDETLHCQLYEANVLFVLRSLNMLLQQKRLSVSGAKLCVISSIWQTLSRPNKLSYSMTKAALQGLVLSAAADLAPEHHVINAILPGALNTPMTHANLTPTQIANLATATPGGQLATPTHIAKLAQFLTSADCQGMTGQFITVDQGFSHVRYF